MKEICVVHLVWKPLGLELFKRFVDSYKKHNAGIKHDLLLIYKGFIENETNTDYYRKASDLPYNGEIYVKDAGFDLTHYFQVVKECLDSHRYFLFLNSYSRINGGSDELNKAPAAGWLKIMYDWITDSRFDVGLVGCTGSWETAPNLPAFPNYHIRTNAFMIKGEDFLKCERPLVTKEECNLFEAGENSLTRQIEAMGKKVLVVGKDRTGMEKKRWNLTSTYRTGEQENLLISDNRTDHYQYGDEFTRKYLSGLAWGDQTLLSVGSTTSASVNTVPPDLSLRR